MSGNLAKVRKKSGKRPKVRERSYNLCSQGNSIVALTAQQSNVLGLHSYVIHFPYVMFAENLA